MRTFFLFLDLNRCNLQFIDQFINQRNMTTCCNNTYPRDDDHLSSRGCRHSAWKKTKTFFFFLFSHCLCTRVFFLSFFFFFFVHSYNRTKREMFRIDFFWQQTHKYFFHRNWTEIAFHLLFDRHVFRVEHSYANLFEEKLFCVRWLCPADHRYSGSSTSINLFAKVG